MFIILFIWLITGAYGGMTVYLIIPLTLVLLFSKDRFPEILIGFIFILILSDSLEVPMAFAKSFKNIYILMLFFFFIFSSYKQEFRVNLYRLFIPYFIFGFIGLIFSPVFNVSAQKLLSYILLFVTVPNYLIRAYETQGIVFFRNMIYFLFVVIIVGFLFRFYNLEVAYSHGGRLRGVFGNPNGLGIYMILFVILFTIINIKFPDLFSKFEIIVLGLFMFYVLYKTGSRTALLAIVLFFLFNQIFKYSTFFGFFFFFVTMIGIEFIVFYLPKIIVAFGLEESFRLKTLEQGSGRLIAWEFAWKNIQDSLFIGRGFGFDENLMRKNFDLLSRQGHEGGVHNTYLIMWLNTGLFGLLSFLGAFFALFIKGAKNNTYSFPAMFAIMLSINFEPWLAASLNPFTILYLVIITLLTADVFNKNELIESNEIELEEKANMA